MIIRDAGVQQRKSKLNSPRREELLRAPGSYRLRPDNTRVDENIPSSDVSTIVSAVISALLVLIYLE